MEAQAGTEGDAMMQLEIPAENPEQVALATWQFAGGATQVWPPPQPIQQLMDPRILGTRFQDSKLIHSEFAARLVSAAQELPPNYPGAGGKKVRDAITWEMPAARLLLLRAMLLFCRTQGVREAHVVDRWANVMEHGDYSGPHSHYESQAAVVYFLDPGESDPARPLDGKFELIDPRVPFCCSTRPECPTRGLVPGMEPGTMILFPAVFLHHVTPYPGRRPRITLAINISAGPPPKVYDPTKPVAYQMGRAMPR